MTDTEIIDALIFTEGSPEEIGAWARLCSRITRLEKPLRSMVEMMDSGDEPGRGSPWHKEATEALKP